MPARSSESKTGADGVVEKLRVRRPCSRISNPRTRSESCRRMQRRSGMIVTMSVEQSGGIALKTAEGIAASHTRQVSTTSTLFGPLGVSIGVVCESTTENKEVVVDMKNCSKDNTNLAIDWNVTAPEYENLLKNTQNRPPLEFRKSLSFLADRQFEMLSLLNVKSIQHLLDMPLRKVLEIKLSNQQLQLLLAMLETEVNTSPKSLKLSSEKMESLKSIAEELDKIDLNDDDDEQPLVIDETISNIEENKTLITKDNERSVDAIEECFSKIRNVKIPQTRAALKDVRSELTEMIAELNEKENRLSRQLQQNNQLADAVNNKESTGHDNEDVVTTTSKAQPSISPHGTDAKQNVLVEAGKLEKSVNKPTRGPRTAKRRRKVNKSRNLKSSTTTTTKNTDNTTCDMIFCLNSTSPKQPFKESSKITKPPSTISSALDVISPNTNFDVAASPTIVNALPMLDSTTPETPSTFSGSSGIFFIDPRSMVILHDSAVKGNGTIDKPIVKSCKMCPKKPEFHLTASKSAVLVDVCASNLMAGAPEQLCATPNVTAIGGMPLIEPDSDDTNTLSKEYIDCKVQKITKPLKSFSAAPTQQNLQPTVLIKKLSTPLRKREHNVDADSTTTSIELCSSKEKKLETNDNENVSCAQSRDVHVSKKTKIAQYPKKTRKRLVKVVDLTDDSDNPIIQAKPNYFSDISDNSDDLAEVCVSESSFMMEGIEVQASDTNLASVSHESEMNDAKHNSKSVSPASPLFESIKSDLEENDIINDREQKGPLITCELVDDLVTNSSIEESRNQTVSSYCSITPKDKEKCEDSIIHSPAQRRIEFDAKSCTKTVDDYSDNDKDDSHNAALTVKIANTPLSPISSGITSPINTFTFREYKPTAEIDGCCAEIIYLLKEIDIPNIPVNKPDDLDLLLRTNSSDPRLFKYLKKNANAVHGASSLCVYSKVSQSDPRRSSSIYNSDTYLSQRPQEPSQQTPNMLLYGCLQRSPWYQSLMSTMKIQINQTVSVLVHAINSFQKMRLEYPNAVFDIFKLYCAGELLEILENLGLFVDVNGVISEKKNVSSFAGRSYGCSSVVNATYSFIQPVEPPSVTVQHQQMRSFTAPSANFSAPSATFQQPSPSPSPFISCYIDSPQMAMEKPVQLPKPSLPRPSPITYSRRPTLPQQPPSSPPPRRHCGLKVPYSSRPPRHLWSPIKRQASYSDSEEECWDSDDDTTSSRPSKLPLSPDGSDSSHNSYEVPHRNYSKTEKFVEGRSSNYGKSLESAKKRY
ncbi:uncharacterized protein LOC128865396 isoform X1 [Anastrepha ludens]|uniref:uncharacterized protein LOC128865396 isoform X1 n=1 Tax=Anastrepha ludens TaxID=28586 RepID=UPI0023B01940|nr:uncharacterized protein LOC128865396 isoform X1 [Anastrepha ludens]